MRNFLFVYVYISIFFHTNICFLAKKFLALKEKKTGTIVPAVCFKAWKWNQHRFPTFAHSAGVQEMKNVWNLHNKPLAHPRFTTGFCVAKPNRFVVMTIPKNFFLSCTFLWSPRSKFTLPSCWSRKADVSAGARCWQTSLFACV